MYPQAASQSGSQAVGQANKTEHLSHIKYTSCCAAAMQEMFFITQPHIAHISNFNKAIMLASISRSFVYI